MKTSTQTQLDPHLRDAWLHTLQDLKNQIQTWIYSEPDYNWSLDEVGTKEIEEQLLGPYSVSIYGIHLPEGEVRLEPIAYNYPGHGIAELYAWPTLRRVRLIQVEDRKWRVLTDSGIYLRQDWNRENFVMLVQDLIDAQ